MKVRPYLIREIDFIATSIPLLSLGVRVLEKSGANLQMFGGANFIVVPTTIERLRHHYAENRQQFR